jgi:hypothetical protein
MHIQLQVTPEQMRINYINEVKLTSLLQRFIEPEDITNVNDLGSRSIKLYQRAIGQGRGRTPAQRRLKDSRSLGQEPAVGAFVAVSTQNSHQIGADMKVKGGICLYKGTTGRRRRS